MASEGSIEAQGSVEIGQVIKSGPKLKICRGHLDSIKVVAWGYVGEALPQQTEKKGVLENILYSYGRSSSIDGVVYNLLEDFTCALSELNNIKAVTNGKIPHCEKAEWELLEQVSFLKDESRFPNDDSNYPTKHFRSLMHGVLKGIDEAERNILNYGILGSEHIVLQVKLPGHFTTKLLILEGKRTRDPLNSVWEIVNSCLMKRVGGVLSEEAKDLRKILKREHQPGTAKFMYMLDLLKAFNAFPLIVERHPLFWDESKCAKFLMKVGDLLGQIHDIGANKSWDSMYRSFQTQLNNVRFDWKTKVMQFEKMAGFKNTTFDLLRCIRNVDAHYLGEREEHQNELAPHSTKVFLYFFKEFPELLIHTFYVVYENIRKFTGVFHVQYFDEFFSLEYKLK